MKCVRRRRRRRRKGLRTSSLVLVQGSKDQSKGRDLQADLSCCCSAQDGLLLYQNDLKKSMVAC